MDSGIVSALLTYGPLGIFTILFLVGWIVPKPTVDTLIGKLERENEALRTAMRLERERGDTSVTASTTTVALITALKEAAEESRAERLRRERRERSDLTRDDLFP